MTPPPPQEPDADDAAHARTREVAPEPVVQARPGRASPRLQEPEPPAPARIRHFTVLRQIGQGGMGVVLSAFDDELDRKVAIKLMRPSQGDSLGRARLHREAQAMAKLAHPNIARVYEVGEFEGRIYIVMEFIQGETLRSWLRRARHPWREVLAVLLQAGRGLAAAHAAGLVHRDFKPDNVMVAEDGFVRVLDFGLARAVDGSDATAGPGAPLVAAVTHSAGSLSEQLTEAGTLVGTPPYMSPEQFALQPIGVESDQFSFCVALYEGLHGARPFKARGADDLLAQIEALQRSEAPRGSRVPARLRRIVLRGLSARPQDRWPSMQALLEELAREPGKRARQWFAGVGIAALAAGVGYGLTPRDAAAPLCKDAAARLAGVWDDARRLEVRQALRATGAAHADDVAGRVEARLDDYAQRWIAMHTGACEATHLRGEQSPALLDRRMECLNLRRAEVDVLVQSLAAADAALLGRAVQATLGLGRLEPCADADALMATLPPPPEPAQAARVAELRAQLARVRVRGNLGHYEASRALADALLREAAEVGYRPLHAEVLARHAQLLEYAGDFAGAERTMLDAYFMAGAVGHDRVQADAAIALTFIAGVELSRHDDAMLWDRHGAMLIERLGGDDPLLQVSRHTGLGGVLERWGKYAEAREHLERALAIAEADEGPVSLNVATVAHNLGGVLLAQGDLAAAERLYRRSHAIYVDILGPDNLAIADSLNNLGMTALLRADLAGAREHLVPALAIYERSVGAEHPRLSIPLVNLGAVAIAERDLEAAHAYLQRALVVTERALGPDDLEVAEPLSALAELAVVQRRWDDAEALGARALDLHTRAQGPPQPGMSQSLCALGEVALHRREYADASDHFRRALEVTEATYGPDDIAAATALHGLARAALGERRPDQALPLLARALAIRDAHPSLPHERAELRFSHARALHAARDPAAADSARAALAEYAAAGERFAAERAEVESWLARELR